MKIQQKASQDHPAIRIERVMTFLLFILYIIYIFLLFILIYYYWLSYHGLQSSSIKLVKIRDIIVHVFFSAPSA